MFLQISVRKTLRFFFLFPVYDALTGEMVKENKGHKTCVRDVSWHPYLPEMISSSVSVANQYLHFFLHSRK